MKLTYLNKYCGSIIEGNVGPSVMHIKPGCEQEGLYKQNIYTNGRYYDEILFGLTKQEYLKMIDSNK